MTSDQPTHSQLVPADPIRQAVFQRTLAPTRLAGAPTRFSYSTLQALRRCPRQWQLLRSSYAPLGVDSYPEPPSAARIAGRVVHEALEALVPKLVAAGSPPLGSREAAEVLRAFNPRQWIAQRLKTAFHEAGSGPRARLLRESKITAADCTNRLFRLLRRVWKPRRARSASSSSGSPGVATACSGRAVHVEAEVRLQHPTLPLLGVIDLVERDDTGVVITDYKTGAFDEAHIEQIQLYALLWWRSRGELPSYARVVALFDDVEERGLEPDARELQQLEQRVAAEITSFVHMLEGGKLAPGRAAESACQFCPVRHLCKTYWTHGDTRALRADTPAAIDAKGRFVDAELRVTEVKSHASLKVTLADGSTATLVAHPTAGYDLSLLASRGDRIRGLGLVTRAPNELEAVATTELFVL